MIRYRDSAWIDDVCPGNWFDENLIPGIMAFRGQFGFFRFAALRKYADVLHAAATSGYPVNFVLGSNSTDRLTVEDLNQVRAILDGEHAHLTVVALQNALFHPKVAHILCPNGTTAKAMVGSANLTESALGINVEAWIELDSEPIVDPLLAQIANAIDQWHTLEQIGVTQIRTDEDVQRLLATGIVITQAERQRARTASGATGGGSGGNRATRPPRWRAPNSTASPEMEGEQEADEPEIVDAAASPSTPPLTPPVNPAAAPASPLVPLPATRPRPAVVSVNRPGFPDEVLFDPSATAPTRGANALSENRLANDSAGLIIRLTKDDTRHFAGGPGTGNINLPVASIPTLRFGVLGESGSSGRPRAEFDIRFRYLGRGSRTITLPDTAETNVMLYGYLPGETAHKNRRMPVPNYVRQLADRITRERLPLPNARDLALLEWPTMETPEFRMSYLDPSSSEAEQARNVFADASGAQKLARNACLLPQGMSPPWRMIA